MKPLFHILICLLALRCLDAPRVLAWSEPHNAITHAALRVLSEADRAFLGEELQPLGDRYCLIPDHVFSNPGHARFAMMDSRPGERYLSILHLPTTPPEYEEVLRYFTDKASEAFTEQRLGDGARFAGTICHLIEDYCSPSHVMPGDNMLTLLRQFLPPSPRNKHRLMHGPVESGALTVDIAGYVPRLLGISVPEVAWRLTHRIHEGIVHARSTTLPILKALDAEDPAEAARHQLRAAEMDARIVADALHSLIALGSRRFADAEKTQLATAALGKLFPLEAPALFYPQKQFFGSPHWGHPTHGYVLREGADEEPLKLRTATPEGTKEVHVFPDGIGAGGRSALTYSLPEGVFSRFSVFAGLHAELGVEGAAEFTVEGDGTTIQSVSLRGTEDAVLLDCTVTGIRHLRLITKGLGTNPKKNYAVWADPVLRKDKD